MLQVKLLDLNEIVEIVVVDVEMDVAVVVTMDVEVVVVILVVAEAVVQQDLPAEAMAVDRLVEAMILLP